MKRDYPHTTRMLTERGLSMAHVDEIISWLRTIDEAEDRRRALERKLSEMFKAPPAKP